MDNMEIQIWVLTGVVSLLFAILLILFKIALERIDRLIHEVHQLTSIVSSQKSDIARVLDKNNEQDRRLNDHSERIRILEIKQGQSS